MPILLAVAFWLVVTVHGEVRYQAGPMTANACALQMAFHTVKIRSVADESGNFKIKGRVVAMGDVEIACMLGEEAT